MFESENSKTQFLAWKRNQKKELILQLEPAALPKAVARFFFKIFIVVPFKTVGSILSIVDQATAHKAPILLGLGLGVGVIAAIFTTIYPQLVNANPDAVNQTAFNPSTPQITIERVHIPEMHVDADVTTVATPQVFQDPLSNFAVYQIGTASIGQGKTVVLQGFNTQVSLAGLEKAQLNQEVYVLGSNNGWYRFTVVEVRFTNLQELPGVLHNDQETLVLYTIRPLSQNVIAVVARPNK